MAVLPPRELSDDEVVVSSTSVRMVSNSQKKTTVVNGITIKDMESFEESVMISIGGPPEISVLSPKNGATDVNSSTRFSIAFSENVTLGEGAISIHRFDDESVFATLRIPSAQVEQAGFQGMSFRFANPLPSAHYYITMTEGSIRDTDEELFQGIKEKTVWHFTTAP